MNNANPMISFNKATREQSKASIVIEGLSGKGKSGLALLLGYHLADKKWEDVFAIDTENNSLQLFTDTPSSSGCNFENFKIGDFSEELGYSPSNYRSFKEEALKQGAKVVIQDSLTHAWNCKGGVLDLVTNLQQTNSRYARNNNAAWGDNSIVEEKHNLQSLFRDSRCHIISTVRVKEKIEYTKDENGKTVLKSLGEQQIMQADMKYEPDLVIHMLEPGNVETVKGTKVVTYPKGLIIKSRYTILKKDEIVDFTPAVCEKLRRYLNEGIDPETLMEEQRQDYIKGCTNLLDNKKNLVPVWQVLKKDYGFEKTPIGEMPLDVLKDIYNQLTN